ncbi:MAG: ParB/RepB/Spo0J family partition protein [Actinomycetia bacterium]|nr:ParB/RepB/Spo0J family partition protein [Actinomycetes bacterium]MCP4960814.1 ParB/RepB/Spo0J family partition protein [Actinomycetes bacterium]
MARQGGLGRGLGALIPAAETLTDSGNVYRELRITDIVPNQYQPRDHFDEEALVALTASVRELGVLQPILVRASTGGGYELIAGERRWRAAQRAGLEMIPAIVREVDDLSSLAQAVVENIHRQDLNPLEEAAAYRQLLEDFGLTHEELGMRMGKSRAAITNTLRLLQLPARVQRHVASGELSAGHARAILGCEGSDAQEEAATRVLEDDLSVRGTEALVRALAQADADADDDDDNSEQDDDESSPGATRPAAFLELEELMAERLSTRVRIQTGTHKGRITIDFADLDDLERIYRVVQGS